MSSWLRLMPLTVVLVLSMSTSSQAFFLYPHPRRICTEVFHNDLVLTGKVLKETDHYDAEGSAETITYRVKVLTVFKGPQQEVFDINTGWNSGAQYLDVGKEYLLFAKLRRNPDDPLLNGYFIGGGDNNGLLSESAANIKQVSAVLKKHATSKTGSIRGRVYSFDKKDMSGIKFEAFSGKQRYQAESDAEGWFEFDVLPGIYRVEPQDKHGSIQVYDLSYDDPAKVEIKAGECAEVAFR
ncbi:hypothetical protein [Kordiimonas marina]|uniref:hypothetical protein n=1 Tax=Kordiimonas marina TaxID=2872312 RepID=UPI001FF5A0B9|nr:hypothetical protein [Kordiimonas marina]MCJ9430706.1 hypothetical protein [Kordiimonas marina]